MQNGSVTYFEFPNIKEQKIKFEFGDEGSAESDDSDGSDGYDEIHDLRPAIVVRSASDSGEMSPTRLERVSESNEDINEKANGDEKANSETKEDEPLKRKRRGGGHVTINTKAEDMEHSDSGSIGGGHGNRRPSAIGDFFANRRQSTIMTALRSPKRFVSQYRRDSNAENGSAPSLNEHALQSLRKNRRIGDDALSSALSALYAKIVVILGIALPVTEVLTSRIPSMVYQSFYVYLYSVSILFVVFVYTVHLRRRAVFSVIKTFNEKTSGFAGKPKMAQFGSFYLRVGAISFGIGTMVYSGLEFGQFFEQNRNPECTTILTALTPCTRMLLSIIQMQFIFMNTTDLDFGRHKVVARFGLMHMVASNLCEWLYVLVEETKHDIHHFHHNPLAHKYLQEATAAILQDMSVNSSAASFETNSSLINASLFEVPHVIAKRELVVPENLNCSKSTIMATLIQNASPFLFPCTIEYSLICAVVLFEMWKNVKSIPNIERHRRASMKPSLVRKQSSHHFSVDCSRAHRGMFAGILVIVLTIICLIMYFVLREEKGYEKIAISEVVYSEILLYLMTTGAVMMAVFKMRDLKFQTKTNEHHASTVSLDCTLLVLAQTGVYLYGLFSIIGCYFAMMDGMDGGSEGLLSESLGLMQTSLQTLFILNASWRRCKGSSQQRTKPGREMVTFLLVANMSLWFINTLIKSRASFRPTHLSFYGLWAWTVITHVSMPLAIYYRFHSTICLFEIWKSAYKSKEH